MTGSDCQAQNSIVSHAVLFAVALRVSFLVQTTQLCLWLQPPAKRLKTENGAGESSCDDDNKAQEPCLLRELQRREVTAQQGAAFWQEGWREKLCKCSQCMVCILPLSLSFSLTLSLTLCLSLTLSFCVCLFL